MVFNTVIVQLADLVLAEFLKVIVAVPADLAVTSPDPLTVATPVLLLVHCVPSDALVGFFVPVSCAVSPIFSVLLVGLTDKLIIEVETLTEHCAVYQFCVTDFKNCCVPTLQSISKHFYIELRKSETKN